MLFSEAWLEYKELINKTNYNHDDEFFIYNNVDDISRNVDDVEK